MSGICFSANSNFDFFKAIDIIMREIIQKMMETKIERKPSGMCILVGDKNGKVGINTPIKMKIFY